MKEKARRIGGTEARSGGAARDRRIVMAVCRWFEGNARELPWRAPAAERRATQGRATRDPYWSLVSEFMLQQTQVSRVLEKFGPFVERFPTMGALAAADEAEVMAAWSGMGYYRRARNLHAAAREIVSRHGGRVPERVEELTALPGVGRYTAGAIASMVFGRAEPLVDGNVARVLMRVDGKEMGVGEVWGKAAGLVQITKLPNYQRAKLGGCGVGVLNEGLMELGAVVCVPRGPRCGECPLRGECRARAKGLQGEIPAAKVRAARKKVYCAAVVVEDSRGRVLMERRGEGGMWAGLWQAPTLEGAKRAAARVVEEWIGARGLARVERFAHGTTHREIEFEVWRGSGAVKWAGAVWRTRKEIETMGVSNAQRRVLLGVVPGVGRK